jgi:nucleoside-diphosphate-sugar epimerase
MDSMQRYRGLIVVVLGGSGFLGRWVARKLCLQGALVHLVVRNRAHAKTVFAQYGVDGEIFELDLANDAGALRDLLLAVRPVITFNLAGYGIDHAERDEEASYKTNAQLVSAVCDALAVLKPRRRLGQEIIHVGSALEYGAIGGNLAEDSEPKPTTIYGKSKLAGTQALTERCRTLGISGLTARLFTLYGPGEHEDRLLPSLLRCGETGELLEMTSGTQQRDFTYVEDAAEGLLRLGLANTSPGSIVNLATGRLASVRSFAETAASLLRIPSDQLKFGALATRAEEMAHSAVSIDRLRDIVAWSPTISIADGISRTLRFKNASIAVRESHD